VARIAAILQRGIDSQALLRFSQAQRCDVADTP
jgi:hypothetical protein